VCLVIIMQIVIIGRSQTGLTKQEIEDFIRGIHTDAERNTEGNNYAHEFAAARPYAKEYEIPKEKFQVGKEKVYPRI